MPPLFPRWSNTAFRLILATLILGAAGAPALFVTWAQTPYATGEQFTVDQPVEFDHRHHVVDDGIDCRYCHQTVDKSPTASIPATETCMGCHSQVWNQSPLLEPVRR